MEPSKPKSIEALRRAAMGEGKITVAASGEPEFRGPQSSAVPCLDEHPQKVLKRSTYVCRKKGKKKKQELWIEKIRGTVNPADLMTKHLDGKRLVMLCELLNIKREFSSKTDDLH